MFEVGVFENVCLHVAFILILLSDVLTQIGISVYVFVRIMINTDTEKE